MSPAAFHVVDAIAGNTATGTVDDLAEVLPGWYPDAPSIVTQGISDLLDALRRRGPWDAHAHALGLTVTRVHSQ